MIQLIAGFKAFHASILKTIVGVQEENSLYLIDKISLPTTRLGRNESKSDWKQEMQGWWCLDSSIAKNHPRMHYNVEEHLNL